MQLTLLQTVAEFCKRVMQPVPATVYGSSDKAVVQCMALLQEGLDAMAKRVQWQELRLECTFLTKALEDQGSLDSVGQTPTATSGLDYILPSTLWDRTNRLPLIGKLDAQDWQLLKAWVVNGPRYRFILRGRHLLVNPVPTAGWTWAFEYMSEFPIQATAAGALKKYFTGDSDVILLQDSIVLADLRWRWKKEKGLAYAQEMHDFEKLILDAGGRNQPGKALHMDDCPRDAAPGIFVPSGSWPVP